MNMFEFYITFYLHQKYQHKSTYEIATRRTPEVHILQFDGNFSTLLGSPQETTPTWLYIGHLLNIVSYTICSHFDHFIILKY